MQSGDLELQLLLCSSGFGLGKMITAEYAEEARFFLQRVISWIASIAAMFYTAKESDDPPNGRIWTLSPDGDVHPETLLASAATGLVWLDGRHQHILTTLMVAGHRSVRVYGFGVQRRNFSPKVIVLAVFVRLEAEDTCVEDKTLVVPKGATPLTTPVSSPDRGV